MIKKILNRYDVWFVILFFSLSIPFEYYEVFSLVEEQLISLRHSLRHHYGDHSMLMFKRDKIVMVTIDQSFFNEYRGFPLKRSDLSKIIQNINSLKPKVICIDLLLKYSSSYGDDPILSNTLKQTKSILASQLLFDKKNNFTKISYPVSLMKDRSETGYVNMTSTSAIISSLSRLKIYPEAIPFDGGWPIAIQTLSTYLGVKPALKNKTLHIGDINVQLNQYNELYIDYVPLPPNCHFLNEIAGITALEFFSFSELDTDEINELSFWIKDKIVILADITNESHDKFNTPVGTVYGSEIIANTIHTLFNNAPLRPASVFSESLSSFIFLLSIIIIIFLIQDPKYRAGIIFLIFIVYILSCIILYIHYHIVLSMTYTLAFGLLSVMIIFLRSYIIERNLKLEALMYQAVLAKSYSRFVPHEYLGFLSKNSIVDVLLGDHISKEMSVMFSDIRSFTTLSETMTPQENFDFVNAYLKRVSPIIREQNGFIVKYLGDGMMAIFPNSYIDSIQAALKKLELVNNYNLKREKDGRIPIHIGIGLHYGHMMVGMVGEKFRMQGDAFSDDVNLTARLEGLTKLYGVSLIISEAIYRQLVEPHNYNIRFLDNVKVKGKTRPIKIYEIFDADPPEIKTLKIQTLPDFKKGQALFFQKEFSQAAICFNKVIKGFPKDKTVELYLERINNLLNQGVCEDWDIADIKQK